MTVFPQEQAHNGRTNAKSVLRKTDAAVEKFLHVRYRTQIRVLPVKAITANNIVPHFTKLYGKFFYIGFAPRCFICYNGNAIFSYKYTLTTQKSLYLGYRHIDNLMEH